MLIRMAPLIGAILLGSAHAAFGASQEAVPDGPVGKAPDPEPRSRQVVMGFDERSVLTSRGTVVVEPSLGYTHASTTDVAIQGFTILPALAVGLINVSEVQRDTATESVALRVGVTHRLELALRVPFVYKREEVRERRLLKASPTDILRSSDGSGLGDIEMALRYQFNRGLNGWPFFIGNLRAKTRTGDGPFAVDRQQLTVDDDDGNPVVIGEVFQQQPTGSGFWGVEPSITMIVPSDPAVFYANVSYLWNIARDVGEEFGRIDPGDAVGVNFGMGLSINETMSFSMGYDHRMVFSTERDGGGDFAPQFDQIQVGSVQLGFTARPVSLSLAIGATESAPDVQLQIRRSFQW